MIFSGIDLHLFKYFIVLYFCRYFRVTLAPVQITYIGKRSAYTGLGHAKYFFGPILGRIVVLEALLRYR